MYTPELDAEYSALRQQQNDMFREIASIYDRYYQAANQLVQIYNNIRRLRLTDPDIDAHGYRDVINDPVIKNNLENPDGFARIEVIKTDMLPIIQRMAEIQAIADADAANSAQDENIV